MYFKRYIREDILYLIHMVLEMISINPVSGGKTVEGHIQVNKKRRIYLRLTKTCVKISTFNLLSVEVEKKNEL